MQLQLIVSTNLLLLRAGGAIIGDSTEIANKLYNGKLLPGPKRTVIVMSTHLKRNLSELEFKAIYYHELGHYALGHMFGHRRLIDQKLKELEADKYAARHVGAENVLSALNKLPGIVQNCKSLQKANTSKISTERYDQKMDLFLENLNKNMQYRFDALNKLIQII